MDAVETWTTSSSSDCGAASNTKKSACTITMMFARPVRAWADTSTFTIASGFISRSTIKPRQPSVIGNRLENGSPAIHLNSPDFLSGQWSTPHDTAYPAPVIIGKKY